MKTNKRILRVALPTPLRRIFDYLAPNSIESNEPQAGKRVSVPFGRRKEIVGIIVSTSHKSDLPQEKLKQINNLIDKHPIIDKQHLEFLLWASRYYHYPVGEVIFSAIPGWLRQADSTDNLIQHQWALTIEGLHTDLNDLKKSAKQAQILNYLKHHEHALSEAELKSSFDRVKPSLLALEKKGLVKQSKEESEKG